MVCFVHRVASQVLSTFLRRRSGTRRRACNRACRTGLAWILFYLPYLLRSLCSRGLPSRSKLWHCTWLSARWPYINDFPSRCLTGCMAFCMVWCSLLYDQQDLTKWWFNVINKRACTHALGHCMRCVILTMYCTVTACWVRVAGVLSPTLHSQVFKKTVAKWSWPW